ncbi:hypothetical protein QBC46DRAFT_438139 [Diplogelasinospora grovesii]|uniref:Calcineurin-like phosphoesterase domain-containing protein n=1 Tax=Diplogelasinospora grovesii TaxID=303347 RepID=A0AAN6N6X1_9PEZI|nr:hypothetical protein QBC46DRAFT_438139 [Diplogelasinospora grovesii]
MYNNILVKRSYSYFNTEFSGKYRYYYDAERFKRLVGLISATLSLGIMLIKVEMAKRGGRVLPAWTRFCSDRVPAHDRSSFANPAFSSPGTLFTWRLRRIEPARPLADPVTLIHAGDLTQSGSLTEIQRALNWLRAQPHRHKVVIAGNHDLLLDAACDHGTTTGRAAADLASLDWGDVVYLQDSETTITCANGWRCSGT